MDLYLRGKTALVCASSKGLGYAIARSLAAEGVDLFMCARDQSTLDEKAALIRKDFGVRVETQSVDLAQPEHITEFVQTVLKRMGRVDILINNIGGPAPSAAVNTPKEAWDKGFQQIFLSSTLLTQAILPQMKASGFGRILTITSLSVLEPIEHLVVSTAMRAAVTTYCKTLATEVAANGITVHTVMPGVIHTDRIEQLRKAKADRSGTTLDAEMEKTSQQIPMKRLGKPEEFADLVTFLASPRASYMTGGNHLVDGGLRKSW